jgi:Spy/CpxP family protein refolding chaperone
MKLRFQNITICLIGAGLLAMTAFVSAGQDTVAAQPPVDPAHAAHVAAAAQANAPAAADTGNTDLAQQLSQLQAKVAQLEAVLAKSAPPIAADPAGTAMLTMPAPATPAAQASAAMPVMPGATVSAPPAMNMGMGKMKPGDSMPVMSPGATPAPPMAGMSGAAAPSGGGMMGMMDKMMGMMDKMMGMGGGGMDMMDDNMMKMPPMGGSVMPAALPAAGMSGGGVMDMDKMEMAGMMGMAGMGGGAAGAMPKSSLPGFPGASHLYHIGATGFFLDHPQHIALTTEQQAGLSKAKEQAMLAKSTGDRVIQQAEQDLWMLTAADQPDGAQIEAKLTEIGKLTAGKRLAFIRAVGDASTLLTDEQRQILTGFAPPAPAVPAMAPAAAPMPGGMADM